MSNPEKSNATFKNMKIGVAEQGGFVIKTLVENDGALVEQTIVIDSKQADFIRDFITLHMSEANSDSALTEEPEEAGFYVSRLGHVLKKFRDNDWAYADLTLVGEAKRWSNGNLYTNNWDLVVSDLGNDAFPLKHITEEYLIELTRSKRESEE